MSVLLLILRLVLLLFFLGLSFLRFSFFDIADVNVNASTTEVYAIDGQRNWQQAGFAPATVRRNHLQRLGVF